MRGRAGELAKLAACLCLLGDLYCLLLQGLDFKPWSVQDGNQTNMAEVGLFPRDIL